MPVCWPNMAIATLTRSSPTPPPQKRVKQLKQLYAERQRIISARNATQNRSQQATHALVPSQLLEEQWQQQLQLYKQQIEQLEDQIHQLITTHQGLNRYYQLLLTIPGVGKVTGWL